MRGQARAGRIFGLLLAAPLACSAEVVTLGRAVPDPRFGDSGQPVAKINAKGSADDSPSLTQDLLQIYFVSRRPGLGEGDVYCASRRDRVEPFGAPVLVREVSSDADEVAVAVSPDGRTLWVGSDRPGGQGGVDIWRAERPSPDAMWQDLRNVMELNGESDDIPRPPPQNELVMPIASRREDGVNYQTYLAVRPSRDAPFQIEPLRELWVPGTGMSGGFLTEDGLFLFFTREQGGRGDLYYAWRRSTRDPFLEAIPLQAVNGPADQRAPVVSSDQRRFFFASDRRMTGDLDIFATTLDLPQFE